MDNTIVLKGPDTREAMRAAIRAGKKEVTIDGVTFDIRLGENDYIRFRARTREGLPVGQLSREEDVPEPAHRRNPAP